MARVYNFSAGPAVLPEEVLREAQEEMLDYRGCGMSVMEMSHRGKVFDGIIKEAEKDLRELMNIPDNYKVLFLQGGAHQQFAAVPMNLYKNGKAAYIVTGQWAKRAYQEASRYIDAVVVASSADKTFSYIPDCSDLDIPEDADYVYICENNTIYGTKFWELPNTKGHDLVSDISSCFLSEPVDVTRYGVLYGGVQKNVGPAGVVIMIIREDLIRDDVLHLITVCIARENFLHNGRGDRVRLKQSGFGIHTISIRKLTAVAHALQRIFLMTALDLHGKLGGVVLVHALQQRFQNDALRAVRYGFGGRN